MIAVGGKRLATCLMLFLLGAPCLAAETDFNVKVGYLAGEYGTGASRDLESVTFRVAGGDRFRLRAELPAVRARAPFGVAYTSLGPLPLSDEQRRSRSGGNGSGTGQGEPGTGEALMDDAGWESGLGDLRLGMDARLLGRPAGLYRLDAELELKAPVGDEDKGLGTGEWDARLGLSGERRFWTVTAFAGAGWNKIGDPDWIDLEDAVDGFAGIETEPLARDLMWSVWVEGNTETVSDAGARIVLGAGLRSARKRPWTLSVFAGLSENAEDLGVLFGLSIGGTGRRSGGREMVR